MPVILLGVGILIPFTVGKGAKDGRGCSLHAFCLGELWRQKRKEDFRCRDSQEFAGVILVAAALAVWEHVFLECRCRKRSGIERMLQNRSLSF